MIEAIVAYVMGSSLYLWIAPYLITYCSGEGLKLFFFQFIFVIWEIVKYLFLCVWSLLVYTATCICVPFDLFLKLICCNFCYRRIIKKGQNPDETQEELEEIRKDCYDTHLGILCCWWFERIEGDEDPMRIYKICCCPIWWYHLPRDSLLHEDDSSREMVTTV